MNYQKKLLFNVYQHFNPALSLCDSLDVITGNLSKSVKSNWKKTVLSSAWNLGSFCQENAWNFEISCQDCGNYSGRRTQIFSILFTIVERNPKEIDFMPRKLKISKILAQETKTIVNDGQRNFKMSNFNYFSPEWTSEVRWKYRMENIAPRHFSPKTAKINWVRNNCYSEFPFQVETFESHWVTSQQ